MDGALGKRYVSDSVRVFEFLGVPDDRVTFFAGSGNVQIDPLVLRRSLDHLAFPQFSKILSVGKDLFVDAPFFGNHVPSFVGNRDPRPFLGSLDRVTVDFCFSPIVLYQSALFCAHYGRYDVEHAGGSDVRDIHMVER
jgi:hypothetical protein